jgi:hypothetical protein
MEASEPAAVVVAVAPLGNMKLLPVSAAPVEVPVRLPVHLAPVGQQAMLSAESREQFVPCRQQASELPRLVHGLYPLGQLSEERLRTRRTSKARLDSTCSGAEKGAVSIESTEGRNAAQIPIHQEARILEAGANIVQLYPMRPSDSASKGCFQCSQMLIIRDNREC